MERILLKSNQLISATPLNFFRHLHSKIDWQSRLVGILGERGMGKTTLLLQQIKSTYGIDPQALYISADDIYFSGQSLRQFAIDFRNKGGAHLFIDEIHKYPQWSSELKIINDTIPDIKVVFAGSASIDVLKHFPNLSQRENIHSLQGLSFREYLSYNKIANFPVLDLASILDNHVAISNELTSEIKPLMYLDKYLVQGYYPFNAETFEHYKRELEQTLNLSIESDLSFIEGYDSRNAFKMKQLLNLVAQRTPFKPNLVKISEEIDVHRNTLVGYLFHLEKAKLVKLIYPSGSIISILQKPEKVLLDNPNLNNLLSEITPSKDTLIKTFFANQLGALHELRLMKNETFDVDGKYSFDVGAERKKIKKKLSQPNTYLVSEYFEVGFNYNIPLWLFGLLY